MKNSQMSKKRKSILEKRDAKHSQGFWYTKKNTSRLVDFTVYIDHRLKMKGRETIDFARGPTQVWNTRVTVISIIGNELGTFPKELEKKIGTVRFCRKNRDSSDYIIVVICHYTQKSTGDRRMSISHQAIRLLWNFTILNFLSLWVFTK